MKILLTGAFGNVGTQTLIELIQNGHQVTCFDLKNSKNQKHQKELLKKIHFTTIWGNITEFETLSKAIQHKDCVVHLAAIIPPKSEEIPEIAYKINVNGTQNIIKAASMLDKAPKIAIIPPTRVLNAIKLNPSIIQTGMLTA